MVKSVRATTKKGEGGEVKALLWYQGESDTLTHHDAEAYQGKMEKLISDVAIASGDEKYMEIVREAQLRTKLPNVVCVDAKGLPLKGDNLHLTAKAQVKLGQMLANEYLNNFDSSKPSSS
ncbi:hypothetical protein Ancab_028309 [Ancistrocladus abbreviatus]